MRFRLVLVLLLGSVAAVSNAVAEEVHFETADGVLICGTYYPPRTSSAAALVLLHMLRKNRESWSEFAQFAQEKGYAVLAIDFRGHGQSVQTRTKPIHETDFTEADFTSLKLDVAVAVDWLRKRPEITSDKIALVGAGIGANVALTQAAEDTSLMGVVLLSPGEVYRGIQAEPALRAFGTKPVLIVASEDDNYSSVTVQKLESVTAAKKQIEIYQDGGHGTYLFESHPEAMDKIVKYLDTIRR